MKRVGIPVRQNRFIPWNKGKHGIFSAKALQRMSEANVKKIDLKPSRELGYFCGLIIGDGWIYRQKSRNYIIAIESTKRDIINQFSKSAIKLGLNPSRIYIRQKTRKFPNGEARTDTMYKALVSSKILYDALRYYKQNDFRWEVPKFLTTEESLFGFIGGFFDAEGSATQENIIIGSKWDKNLINFKELLKKLGFIYGRISVKDGILLISGLGNIRLFAEKAELRLKKEKVLSLLQNRPRYHTQEEYEKVMNLRKKHRWGGARISKLIGIPVSTIEDWIYKGKKPWVLKIT